MPLLQNLDLDLRFVGSEALVARWAGAGLCRCSVDRAGDRSCSARLHAVLRRRPHLLASSDLSCSEFLAFEPIVLCAKAHHLYLELLVGEQILIVSVHSLWCISIAVLCSGFLVELRL